LMIDLEEAKFRQINMEQVAKERMREIADHGRVPAGRRVRYG
jgi:hypothetical protein